VSGYVDIHCHVLPGIDDGPSDMDGAITMARAAAEVGTWTLAATPHLRMDFPDVHLDELSGRCQTVTAELEREEIPLRIVCGAEVSLVWALEASEDQLSQATYGQRGTDLLIETPTAGVIGLEQHLYEFRLRGLRITLAHPERSSEFQRKPGQLEELVRQGILLQINSDSLLMGDRRSGTRQLAEHLCQEGLAHALASDGHRASTWRPVTTLARGVEAAAALVGPERAEWMVREAPAAIIAGEELPQPPEVVVRRRRLRRLGRR
jgi:protein-tyrosine phosphatase